MALHWNTSKDKLGLFKYTFDMNCEAKTLAKAEQIFHLLKDPMTLWTLSMSKERHEVGTTTTS